MKRLKERTENWQSYPGRVEPWGEFIVTETISGHTSALSFDFRDYWRNRWRESRIIISQVSYLISYLQDECEG